jgi:TrmH family RNA methyltransferase
MAENIHQENIEIVLVEPQNPGNVGAAARALYNMGLDRLTVVGWAEDLESRRIAYEWATDGEPVLKKARRCPSLAEAIGDCAYAIATSARPGSDRPPGLGRRGLIALLERWTPTNRIAIVFGPERTGLRTEHVELCSHTLMLPTVPGRKSLNLAQAVLLVGYEILLASAGTDEDAKSAENNDSACRVPADRAALPTDPIATRAERQRLYEHARQALEAVGFLRPGAPIRPLHEIGYLLDRAAATAHEVQILHGMCRRILRKVKMSAES